MLDGPAEEKLARRGPAPSRTGPAPRERVPLGESGVVRMVLAHRQTSESRAALPFVELREGRQLARGHVFVAPAWSSAQVLVALRHDPGTLGRAGRDGLNQLRWETEPSARPGVRQVPDPRAHHGFCDCLYH